MRRQAPPHVAVLVAAFVSLASLAVAAPASTPTAWWSNPADPDSFVLAAAIVGFVGGGLKLLVQWERWPGWPRLLGAIGLGPFVSFIAANLLYGHYRGTPEQMMELLAYCGGAGFCCDWVASRFIDIVGRVLGTQPNGGAK